jgi:TolA-binding protein
MGFANRAIVAAGLGFAVSALVGCGGSGGLLSGAQANRLSTQLEQASQDLASSDCRSAEGDINTFRSSVNGLNSVNATLIRNLDQGAQRIQTLAESECQVYTPPTRTTKTHTSTTKTATTKTNTNTTPTTTSTATDTTPTQTTPTTTVITITTTTDTTPTGTGTGTGTTTTGTGTGTTPGSGGTGLGNTTTTVTDSTGYGDGAQGTG